MLQLFIYQPEGVRADGNSINPPAIILHLVDLGVRLLGHVDVLPHLVAVLQDFLEPLLEVGLVVHLGGDVAGEKLQ